MIEALVVLEAGPQAAVASKRAAAGGKGSGRAGPVERCFLVLFPGAAIRVVVAMSRCSMTGPQLRKSKAIFDESAPCESSSISSALPETHSSAY